MTKKIKRVLSILLVLASLTVCLYGCGSTSQNSQDTSASASVSTTAAAATAPAQKEEPVKIVWINIDENYSNMLKNPETVEVHDYVLNKLNVDLQPLYVAGDQFENRVTMQLASGDQLDIIIKMPPQKAIEYFNSGVTRDLTDLVSKSAPNYLKVCSDLDVMGKARKENLFKGKDICMPQPTTTQRANCLEIRSDWLKKLNMSAPTTLAELETYFEAVKTQDPDGNGKKDTYGICNSVWNGQIIYELAMYFLPAGREWWLDQNGELQSPITHPNYKTFLAKQIEWMDKGYLPPDMYTAKEDQLADWISNNKIGSLATWYSAPIGSTVVLQEKVPEASYIPINIKGLDGAANALPNQRSSPNANLMTASCKNPEAVMRFWDWLYSEEGQKISMYGMEGKSYKLVNGQPDTLKDSGEVPLYYAAYNPYIDIADLHFGIFPGVGPVDQIYRDLIKITDGLPGFDAPAKLVTFDTSKFESKDKLTDLDTFITEKRLQILTKAEPLDTWDNVVAQWRTMGGDLETKDRNLQYKEWLTTQK